MSNDAESNEANLAGLRAAAKGMAAAIEVKDRKHRLKTYEQCFLGTDAVRHLVSVGAAEDEEGAVAIGQRMLENGLLHHVVREHDFKNEPLFYRFREAENHGEHELDEEGRVVSWEGADPADAPEDADPTLSHNVQLLDHTHPRRWRDPAAPKERYNLVCIGAGVAGLVSAIVAAGAGARVAMIEENMMGGDCLNTGCVPSKALIRCAKAVAQVRRAAEFGVSADNVRVDFPAVMERLRRLRAGISKHDSAERFARAGVDVFIGRATFTGADTVEVNGQTLHFHKAAVCTGAAPFVPPSLRVPGVLTNTTLFNLVELPRRLAVVGGGPIGVEMAQAFARLGSEVTVVDIADHVLSREDADAAEIVQRALVADGVSLLFGTVVESVDAGGDEYTLHLKAKDGAADAPPPTLVVDKVLVATGRAARVDGFGLEAAGVEYDRRGITVNDHLRTSNANVYAAGDVCSVYKFTHAADVMAKIVVRNALFLGSEKLSDAVIPWCTYSDPEVAHVGRYAHELAAEGVEFDEYKRDVGATDRAILDGDGGFVKILVKKGTDHILGATIVATHAGDMISELTVAMVGGVGLGKIAEAIHPYPTQAEAIKQAAGQYTKTKLKPWVRTLLRSFMGLRR